MSAIFDITTPKMLSAQWVVHYCLNKFSENKNIPAAINSVLVNGQIESEGNWGIHRWNKRKALDHGVARFDGFRLFIGPDEHGLPEYEKFIDAYISELDLKHYLIALVEKSPTIANKSEIQELIGRKRATTSDNELVSDEPASLDDAITSNEKIEEINEIVVQGELDTKGENETVEGNDEQLNSQELQKESEEIVSIDEILLDNFLQN